MREIRQSGSEGGVALTPPSLPLSAPHRRTAAPSHRRTEFNRGCRGSGPAESFC
jgi:hypothetical protein